MYRRDTYLEKIRPYQGLDIVKILTGMRRSGKSVLLRQLCSDIEERFKGQVSTIFMNLEEEENACFCEAGVFHRYALDFAAKHGNQTIAVFLDEVQMMESWEKTVNSLRCKSNFDLYLTGSNSRLLSGELVTLLTGRYVAFQVFPYSFREFIGNQKASGVPCDVSGMFLSYLQFGGLPFLAHLSYQPELCRTYMEDLYSSILLKDIVERKQIRNPDLLSRIVKYVLQEAGHQISASSLVRYLKSEHRSASLDTVLDYLTYCEEAFLVSRAKRQELRGKAILSVDEKFYAMDHGLRRMVIGGDAGKDVEQALENIVYIEMLRRGYQVTIGRIQSLEVDFACQKGEQRLYIQVAYLLATEENRQREFRALAAIPDQYPKIVLSMDAICQGENGIQQKYLPNFLLEE